MDPTGSPDVPDLRYRTVFRVGGVAFMLVGTCYTIGLWL